MDTDRIMKQVNALVDEYRARCLWYLREDNYPQSVLEARQVLAAIERHRDATAFRKAAPIRQWISQNSNEPSAG